MSSRIVMRPKSIATVVVVLCSTPSVRSTYAPGALRSSSVRSGRISVTELTRVVLPAPKPPAIRIFIATGADGEASRSKSAKAIRHLPQELRVRQPCRHRMMNRDEPAQSHFGEQDPAHAERRIQSGGE